MLDLKISVRSAKVKDSLSLAELHVNYAREFNLSLDVSSIDEVIRKNLEYCVSSPEHTVLVAEVEDQGLIAYMHVCWSPILHYLGPEGHILDMLVKQEFRGKGIGTNFLNTVERTASERGCVQLVLCNYRSFESYHRGFYRERHFNEEDVAYFRKILDAETVGKVEPVTDDDASR